MVLFAHPHDELEEGKQSGGNKGEKERRNYLLVFRNVAATAVGPITRDASGSQVCIRRHVFLRMVRAGHAFKTTHKFYTHTHTHTPLNIMWALTSSLYFSFEMEYLLPGDREL